MSLGNLAVPAYTLIYLAVLNHYDTLCWETDGKETVHFISSKMVGEEHRQMPSVSLKSTKKVE